MELKDVLVRPLVTEKSTSFLGSDRAYAFEVGVDVRIEISHRGSLTSACVSSGD